MADRPGIQQAARKIKDRSLALVLVAIFLLMPPMVAIALIDARLAGIPVTVLYIFATWLALIAAAAVLARPLERSEDLTGAQPQDEAGD